jgi:proline iminopeptidase
MRLCSGALALLVSLAACAKPARQACSGPNLVPGEARLPVHGGSIWYRITGTGHGTPVILLHGGPGYSSFYLKPFEDLADDRPVVRYDQLGGGKSDRISDTTLFTVEHFVRELDSLRAHLGCTQVHLFGHSWGTILAFEYYRAHPDHVASLILGSPALDAPAWERGTRRMVATLSPAAQRAIRIREAQKRFEAADYQAAVNEYWARYGMRSPVAAGTAVAADADSTASTFNAGIYGYMWGPSEFTPTGTLKIFDATGQLGSIRVPTLYTVGEFDEADTANVRRFTALTPGARMVVLPGAAHMTPWDARDENVRVVRAFLRAADSTSTRR